MGGRVVHVNDNVPGAVYVGRAVPRLRLPASPFANPYRIGPDGGRAEVVAAYRWHILSRPDLLAALPGLRGRDLSCWCRRDGEPPTARNLCHASVLLRLLADHDDERLRAMAAEKERGA